MHDLITATAQIERQGWRRLLVISGETAWCAQQAADVMALLPGDWLWAGKPGNARLCCEPQAIRTLLGREFHHAVFDARDGFHAEAFAALAGTLRAGSWLLLLVPEWDGWAQRPDADSLRWSEGDTACASTHFVHHVQQSILADPRVVLWRQPFPQTLSLVAIQPDWQVDNRAQQNILTELLNATPGIYALTAARGRGKSALAGMLAAHWPGRCRVTAPGRVSTDVLARFAGECFQFVAPDRLLAEAEQLAPGVDWLLIDEAAAIPAPLLQRLVGLFPRVLLTTTVQGYEGTGRGFMLKFCASLPAVTHYQLDEPLRWAANDPLEQIVAGMLLFEDGSAEPQQGAIHYSALEQDDWLRQPARMAAIYQLLTSAHYRTSPLDLRRMMDAPGMHFLVATQAESVQGALWLVDEGGLSSELAAAVWAGKRRPRGNLVAQSLAAHGGSLVAPQLRSRRISRIAVSPLLRGRGIGQQLIAHALEHAQGLDYLSVSFGFTVPLWRFWQRCGYKLVRIGSQREASSGCYAVMAVLPLSSAGERLTAALVQQLARDGYWLRQQVDDQDLPLADQRDMTLTEDDWQVLSGFAWAQRPFEASFAALGRLVSQHVDTLPLLHAALLEGQSAANICARFTLSGRKALLVAWRQEVQQALIGLDASRAQQCEQWINSLQ
ncbi:tRNA(Met) cytidine acetyltransferase TmcA [Erwinia rhapontici]|uniref:tRNA(Met) cytidine acetyltransferase TmcA n=1 Tax=Erwinia rhapontici TaxID=55212 RepID=UPI003B9E48CF